MTPIDVFLADLSRKNLRIALDGEQLRVTPRSALSPDVVEQLRLRKPEIVSFLRRTAREAGARAIQPAPRGGPLPLSYAQERLWFLSQLEGDNTAYNIPMALRLSGPLDAVALERSLAEIVRRHESLRTTFVTAEGQPTQAIGAADFDLPVVDLTSLSDEEQTAAIARLFAADAERPKDLAAGPLFRASLLRLRGSTEHALLLTMHHIISDGLSMGVFGRELAALYGAFRAGSPSPLPELPIQYADFAVWQRARLSSEVMAEQLAYWKQKLAHAPEALCLPQDHPRPARSTPKGGCAALRLSEHQSRKLRAWSQQQETTLFVTLLAALKLLMARLSGQDDIVVGTPVAGRDQVELEGLIGFFLNVLPLRTDLSGSPTFVELVQRVRRATLEAFANQDVPFEKLVADLKPARKLGQSPFFQVLFNMVPAQAALPGLPGLEVTSAAELSEEQAKFDWTLYASDAADGIELRAVYNADIFSADRMAHALEQLYHLLAQIILDPTRSIDTYALVTPGARAFLPDMSLALPEPAYAPIPSVIEAVAERAPEQSAVAQGGRRWSYRALARQAANVERALRDGGLQQGEVVAVAGARSFGLIAAMLGVLASGGVLLLLDVVSDARPPRARVGVMLEQAGAMHLITVTRDEPAVAWLSDHCPRALHIDPHNGLDMPELAEEPARFGPLSPDAPAYIFFTSGSTGTPKGVLGVHKGLSHFLHWQRRAWGVTEADRAAQLTALSFDVVLRDVLLALVSGGTLVLPPEGEILAGARLFDWLEREEITLLHAVPSLAQAWLLDAPEGPRLTKLRRTFFAGEPLVDELVHRWRSLAPSSQVINLYGPTETTLAKCAYQVPDAPPPGVQPVGFPLPETQALVLRGGLLCGVGEPGEIVIRTPFRTKGYLNNPDEQRRRFSRNPSSDDEADLLYFTGDMGRYGLDGSLEILGRTDDQVKIHGVRIELKGIESALCRHPAVLRAVVVTDGEGSDKRLVAYIVPRTEGGSDGEARVEPAALRRYLRESFADYMIPAAFEGIAEIPLLPNGKLNRHALPAPRSLTSLEGARVPPRTPQETQLVQMWEAVLGVAPIGVRDNFFDLGGHSLLAVRLISRMRERSGQSVSLGVFFQHPTVEAVAQLLGRLEGEGADNWAPLVAIAPGGSRPPFFCVPGGHGEVHYLYLLAHHLGKDQPFFGLQSVGLDGVTPPYTSVEAIVDRYIDEIRRVQPRGPYFLGGHSFGGKVAFAMAQRLVGAGERVDLVVFDSLAPGMRHRPDIAWDEIDVIQEIILGLEESHGGGFDLPRERLTSMSSSERLSFLQAYLERVSLLPPGADVSEVRGKINVFQSTKRMDYTPRDAAKLPLRYFAAQDADAEALQQKLAGWSELALVTATVVPGGHLSMLQEPHVRTLSTALSSHLREATDRDRGLEDA